MLLFNANQTVSTDRLEEELWDGTAPAGARQAVRVYVSRIRQVLPGGQDVLVTRSSGYALLVETSALDADRFRALAAQGREQAAAGDHHLAATSFRQALALWRGPALGELAERPFARAEATQLEEARLAVTEDGVDAELACGRHAELAEELLRLTRAHPLRERLWAQRMLALYRSGRQTDALRAYQELRRILGEQLGIEPAEELRRLESAVLRHEPGLDWTGPGTESLPLPRPLRRKERFALVGRTAELACLAAAWESATRDSRRRLVLLGGEPGIGKSRLTAEFAGRVHGDGALVLFGRCDEGMGVPYQPFVEALARYLDEAPRPALGRLAGELARLVPEIGERIPGLPPPVSSDPETERYRLFGAVVAWLAATSRTMPVLFVVEDLHWATRPTQLLLSHLARSDEAGSLLLVATFRDTAPDLPDDLADLIAELIRQPAAERLSLAGLDESGVAAMMEGHAGHELDDDGRALAGVLHAETAGNPFFVREVLRHLAEKGTILRQAGRWSAGRPVDEVDVPDSVREVVGRRLTRLPDRTAELLALSAVLGERFDLATLAAAGGEPEPDVLRGLEPALAARLVEETAAGRYHFTHALVRSALEEALGPTRRAQLHRAAGLAIETLRADDLAGHLPHLARHFSAAGDRHRAVDYATRAGDRALAQLANDEARAYYRQALGLLDGEGDTGEARSVELLIRLGEAERRAGVATFRATLLGAGRLARRQGDASAMARAALTASRGTFSIPGEVDRELVTSLEAALEAVGGDHPALRARLLAMLGVELLWSGEPGPRLAFSDEALALARAGGDPAVLASVILLRWGTLWPFPWARERLVLADELLELAAATEDPHVRFWGLWRRYLAMVELGQPGRDTHDAAAHQADDLGQPYLRWVTMLSGAAQAAGAARLAEAEELARRFAGFAPETGFPRDDLLFTVSLAGIRYEQGRLGEMEPELRSSVERLRGVPLLRALLALAYLELDRPHDARATVAPLRGGDLDRLLSDYFANATAAVLAGVWAELGLTDAAARLADALAPYRDQIASHPGIWHGSFAHHLGRLAAALGRFDEAEANFAVAAATHERLRAPGWLARTRLEWGRMRLNRGLPGDGDSAHSLLTQARAAAGELGLSGVERRAAALTVADPGAS